MDIRTLLKGKSAANYVEYGYGQVEPNHLSAQRTGQIYAQLPTNSNINKLENGQFVKYDYANGEVNFTGDGEWLLVYNEIKLYNDLAQNDCEFAMLKGNYANRIYSPVDGSESWARLRNYNLPNTPGGGWPNGKSDLEKVTAPDDLRVFDYNEDPFYYETKSHPKKMKIDAMVPRCFKTNVGDIYTTNCLNVIVAGDEPTEEEIAALVAGKYLAPNATGILTMQASKPASGMIWQVAKVYTMPDHQRAAKLVRIA